jgi:hypothetical protein
MKPFMVEEIMRYNSASEPALFVAAFDRPAVATQAQQQPQVQTAGTNYRKDTVSQAARRDSAKGQFFSQQPAPCTEQSQQSRYFQQQKVLGGSNKYNNLQQEERMQCDTAATSTLPRMFTTQSQTKPTSHASTSPFSHTMAGIDRTHFAAPQQQHSAYRPATPGSTCMSTPSGSSKQSGVGMGAGFVSVQGCYDSTGKRNCSSGSRMQMNKEEMRDKLKALISQDRVLPVGWTSCETGKDHVLPRHAHVAIPLKKQRV